MRPGDLIISDLSGDEPIMLSARPGTESETNPLCAELPAGGSGLVVAVDEKPVPEVLVLSSGGLGWNLVNYFQVVRCGR